MKTIKINEYVSCLHYGSVMYAKFLRTGKYKIELLPYLRFKQYCIPIFSAKSKPLIKNLFLLNVLLFPINIIASLCYAIFAICYFVTSPFSFVYKILTKYSFIIKPIDRIGAILTIIYSVVLIILVYLKLI